MQMFHVGSPGLAGTLLLQRPCHERVRDYPAVLCVVGRRHCPRVWRATGT